MQDALFITELPDRAAIMIGGADAADFLQNLITQDITRCADGGLHHAALLTPQGKIIAEFLICAADNGFIIDCEAAAAASLIKRLTLYRLRAAVTLDSAPAARHVIWSPRGACPPQDGFTADPRHQALGLRGDTPPKTHAATARTPQDWHAHRLALGIAQGQAEIGESAAFPLEYGLHLTGAIDFQKGCFIGQEVTSRTYRRGRLRKILSPIQASKTLPPIGTPIISGAKNIGEIRASNGTYGLALMRHDAGAPLTANGVTLTCGRGLFAKPQ